MSQCYMGLYEDMKQGSPPPIPPQIEKMNTETLLVKLSFENFLPTEEPGTFLASAIEKCIAASQVAPPPEELVHYIKSVYAYLLAEINHKE